MITLRIGFIACMLFVTGSLSADGGLLDALKARSPEAFTEREWTVSGDRRTAFIRVPRVTSVPLAVVFCWHGHGGRAAQAARRWGFEKVDTTSILVFPQGLPTVSPLVDREGRMSGWQTVVGERGDRDIQLFDSILGDLRREYSVDQHRIYSMGHSNGGAFSYLLWQARPRVLAAIGAVAGGLRGDVGPLPPLPVIHVAGEQDTLVKFSWQERTFAEVRRFNRCSETGRFWAKAGVLNATVFPSNQGAPLVTAIHGGGHEYADGSSQLIARFFKEQRRAGR